MKHSHIGEAAIKELEANHSEYKDELWASTTGKVVGEIQHSPNGMWDQLNDLDNGHTDWFPEVYSDLLAKTEVFCDFISLSPPDGVFLEKIKASIAVLAEKSKKSGNKIVVRFLFGSVIALPVNCTAVLEEFTEGLSSDTNLEVWVGAWRKDMCWNHAKIVAVDGKHVHTGGHNLWDDVYLQKDPIHDTSIELEGPVAIQAHLYCNGQWEYIREQQSTVKGWILSWISDGFLLPIRSRVIVSEWPKASTLKRLAGKGTPTYPPVFNTDIIPTAGDNECSADEVKMLALGRYGKIRGNDDRSADDAIIAMFDASQDSIRLLLQDLGPVNKTVMGKKIVYKSWPKHYMKAWARAIFVRGVDVEIILSNPGAGEERGNYSNGWSCEEVAAEIIKTMSEEFPEATEEQMKKKVVENLRICFLKNKKGAAWETGSKVGLHSKFFIMDDVSTYVGSQNLYEFDLAEWGVVIDDKPTTTQMMQDLWNPAWKHSYLDGSDCDAEKVMSILGVDRGPNVSLDKDDVAAIEADIDVQSLAHVQQIQKSKFYHH
mmetsp:Transcript_14664/g.21959  ORF Transcript_14664/g.21959 Transcript_14664/m.21959 type:complete len:543 (+) Transcript_14664:78-1706(+)